jgi:hypothetical protein
LFLALLDIPLASAFSVHGKGPGENDLMQYHFLSAGSLVFRDLADFSSPGISACQQIRFLSFSLAI